MKEVAESFHAILFFTPSRVRSCSVVLSRAMPLSATRRFQLAPLASSNSPKAAKLHSFVLLVGLGPFFKR
jgi:hypothetical protein